MFNFFQPHVTSSVLGPNSLPAVPTQTLSQSVVEL